MSERFTYRIINRHTGKVVGSRRCGGGGDAFDFFSAEVARADNCHGMFKDKSKYRIRKVRITEEVVSEDVDGAEDTPLFDYNAPPKTFADHLYEGMKARLEGEKR